MEAPRVSLSMPWMQRRRPLETDSHLQGGRGSRDSETPGSEGIALHFCITTIGLLPTLCFPLLVQLRQRGG